MEECAPKINYNLFAYWMRERIEAVRRGWWSYGQEENYVRRLEELILNSDPDWRNFGPDAKPHSEEAKKKYLLSEADIHGNWLIRTLMVSELENSMRYGKASFIYPPTRA